MSEQTGSELVRDQVVVALDVDGLDEALELVDELDGLIERFKVGSKLFAQAGPRAIEALAERGGRVFVDLKLHDIPSVVGQTCEVLAGHESVFMLTAHAVGGSAMIAEAVRGAERGAAGERAPQVVAVTALTSHSPEELGALGIGSELQAWAEQIGQLALEAGADGLVCSARELGRLRERCPGAVLVTPGIRPRGWRGGADDQARVVSPAEAISLGSDYLVIGRPIYQAEDPRGAVAAIARELEAFSEA